MEKGGSDIATKKFRDLTAAEKATRYAYAKEFTLFISSVFQ